LSKSGPPRPGVAKNSASFDALVRLKVQPQQNKRPAQTREAFSGILRALLFAALHPTHGSFLYTISQ